MVRKNRTPEENARREQIRELLQMSNIGSELLGAFGLLDKSSVLRGNGAIICLRPKLSALNAENYIVPVWMV